MNNTTPVKAPLVRHASRAFSLVELMVVLVIIGILATVVGAALVGAGDGARETATKAQMSQIAGMLKVYRTNYGMYPENGVVGLEALVSENMLEPGAIIDKWDQPMQLYLGYDEYNEWVILSSGIDRMWETEDDIVYGPDGEITAGSGM